MKVVKLSTLEEIQAILADPNTRYTPWAQCEKITQHWPVFAGGFRLNAAGQIEINFGEWHYPDSEADGHYLNEEWLVPTLVYAMHSCAECNYPPDMCCLLLDDAEDLPDAYVDAFVEGFSYIPLDKPNYIDLP